MTIWEESELQVQVIVHETIKNKKQLVFPQHPLQSDVTLTQVNEH